jgi:selenocysteine-specific elongation factor
VAVGNDYHVGASALAELLDKLRTHFAASEDIAFGEFRELSGLTRKLGIPMLEYLDQSGRTVRTGDVRRAGPEL